MPNMVDVPVTSGTLTKVGTQKISPTKQNKLYEGLVKLPNNDTVKVVISQAKGHSIDRVLIQLITQVDITDWEFI
mgnify:CR=1 FL=1